MMVLNAQGLSKQYRRGGRDFFAVEDVSLAVQAGEMVGIAGPSGSGKSTLFSLINGLVAPTTGRIELWEQDFCAMTKRDKSRLRSTRLGYILQGQSLLHNFTVMENICMPLYLGSTVQGGMGQGPVEKALALLAAFGLAGMADEYPSALSGGEQRRVAVLRTLLHNPQLIIADEPTSNLDPQNAAIIVEALRKACDEGAAVIVSSHDVDLGRLVDRQFIMDAGRLLPVAI